MGKQPDTMLWERQENESMQAFEAFHLYCTLRNERSINRVARELNKSHALIGRWSAKHNWAERTRAYDNYIVREDVEQARKNLADMRKRQIEQGKLLQSKAVTAILNKAQQEGGLDYESMTALVRMMSTGITIEEKARENEYRVAMSAAGVAEEEKRGITDETRKAVEELVNGIGNREGAGGTDIT
jgi:hypothetical protein